VLAAIQSQTNAIPDTFGKRTDPQLLAVEVNKLLECKLVGIVSSVL